MATLIQLYLPPALTLTALHTRYFPTPPPSPSPRAHLATLLLRLYRALAHLLAEAQSPVSEIIRDDNLPAVTELLSISFSDLTPLVTAIESALKSDIGLPAAAERTEQCIWGYEIAMRVLQRGEAAAVIDRIRPMNVGAELRRVLDVYAEEGGEEPVVRRFEKMGAGLFSSGAGTVVRVLLWWAGRAVRRCAGSGARVDVGGVGDALKACWVLGRMRAERVQAGCKEVRAMVKLISTVPTPPGSRYQDR